MASNTIGDDSTMVDYDDDYTNYSSYYSYYDDVPKLTEHLIVTLTVIFAISVVLSTIGNIIVLCVMTCARRGKASPNTLMINLAMSDWTLGLVCLPVLFTATMMGEWVFGEVLCYMTPFVMKVSQVVSIFTVTVIGLDRYHVVMYPLKRKLSVKGKNMIILSIWLAAMALASPQLIYANHETRYIMIEDENVTMTYYRCGGDWPQPTDINYRVMYVWLLFIVTYVLPLILLSGCYIQVALKLWRRTLPGHIDAQRDREQAVAKRKVIRTLVSLIILFAVCWFPLNFYNLFLTYNGHYFSSHWEVTTTSRACVFIWLILSDTIFNPIVYVFLSENFRKNIKMLIYRAKHCVGMEDDYPYSDASTNISHLSTSKHRGKYSNSIALRTF
ncbi:prolactin-releasing peptide receptor-like isoform X1 [Glandiceps talaboti]